jgi:hypothetical protein
MMQFLPLSREQARLDNQNAQTEARNSEIVTCRMVRTRCALPLACVSWQSGLFELCAIQIHSPSPLLS